MNKLQAHHSAGKFSHAITPMHAYTKTIVCSETQLLALVPASYNMSNITSFCMEWNDFRQIYNAIAANSPCIHKEIVVNSILVKS